MKKALKMVISVVLLIALVISLYPVNTNAKSKTVKLPAALYKQVKGKWYSEASMSGDNVKFTRTKIKFYDRGTDELLYSVKITKVKKIKKGQYKGGYHIEYKHKGYTCYYISTDNNHFLFFEKGGNYGDSFSAGASLQPGKLEKLF